MPLFSWPRSHCTQILYCCASTLTSLWYSHAMPHNTEWVLLFLTTWRTAANDRLLMHSWPSILLNKITPSWNVSTGNNLWSEIVQCIPLCLKIHDLLRSQTHFLHIQCWKTYPRCGITKSPKVGIHSCGISLWHSVQSWNKFGKCWCPKQASSAKNLLAMEPRLKWNSCLTSLKPPVWTHLKLQIRMPVIPFYLRSNVTFCSGGSRNLERGVQPRSHEARPKIFGLPRPLPVTLIHSQHT